MITTRRLLHVVGLTVALLVGGTVSASATFSESVAVATTVGTATIAAPTQVEAKAICTTTVDPVTLTTTTTTELKIEWWRSTSPGVTGYRITALPAGGSPYTLAVTGPTDEVYLNGDPDLLASNPRFTVTTLTSYLWTASSAQKAMQPC